MTEEELKTWEERLRQREELIVEREQALWMWWLKGLQGCAGSLHGLQKHGFAITPPWRKVLKDQVDVLGETLTKLGD